MKILKIFTLLTVAFATPSFVHAQDLMAREATTDFQLKSSNTAKIIEQYQKHEEIAMTSSIYGNNWSNAGVNVYKGVAKPEKLVIDLRDFSMPIKSRIVSSNYGYRERFRRNHYGIDIKGYTGDTIYAAFSGKVRIRKYDANGFGNYVVIRHPNGLETVYGHLSKQLVNENQDVKSGQPIGLCGNTGRSFGSHLHFETRVLGEPINPALMFNFPEQDVTADTYTYRSNENKSMPVATPINSYAQVKETAKTKVETKTEQAAQIEVNTSEETIATPAPASKQADNRKTAIASKKEKESKTKTQKHKVKQGENPSTIAKKYNITVAELTRLNKGMNPSRLQPGQTLIVKK